MTLQECKVRNLNMINKWCKEKVNGKDIIVRNAIWYGDEVHHLYISKDYGIEVLLRFAPYRVCNGDRSLYTHKIGNEIIYQWGTIKELILNAIIIAENQEALMRDFAI